MKKLTQGALQREFKDRKYKHLKKIYEQYLGTKPSNCKYNVDTVSPTGVLVGMCTFGTNLKEFVPGNVCDSNEDALQCKHNMFTCKFDKEALRDAFENSLNNKKLVSTYYKDLDVIQNIIDNYYKEEKLSLWKRFKILSKRIFMAPINIFKREKNEY